MNYLQKKKIAFMSIVNRVKGFIRTITGALPLTLEGCVDEESIIDYTLYGQSVQNGTPTPDTPIEVESVGEFDESTGKYKIPIKVSGKNLFDMDNAMVSVDNWYYIGGSYSYGLNLEVGKQYGFSCDVINNPGGFIAAICRKPKIANWSYSTLYRLVDQSSTTGKKSYTFVADGTECLWLYHSGGGSLNLYKKYITENIKNIQLEEGTATDYEPYHEPITTNIYLDEPLRKVGDYADYIKSVDLKTGKGTVARKVGVNKLLANSNISFTKASTGSSTMNRYFYTPKPVIKSAQTSKGVGYCTVLRKDYEVWNAWTKPQIYFSMANNSIGIVVPINIEHSYPAIYNYLSSNGENEVVIYYQLETPTETPITLPNLPTFKGTSIITADTTIQPSNAEIEYYSNVKE